MKSAKEQYDLPKATKSEGNISPIKEPTLLDFSPPSRHVITDQDLVRTENKLRTEIQSRDEEMKQLHKDIKSLGRDNEKANLKIKKMKKKIEQLEKDKVMLQNKVENIKKEMNSQVHKLCTQNNKIEAELEETKYKMVLQMEKLNEDNSEMKDQIHNLIEDIKKLQKKELVSEEDKAKLHLAQMCCEIENLIYKNVLPQDYYEPEKKDYKAKEILEYIGSLPEGQLREKAQEKWKNINWKKEHQMALLSIKCARNREVGHPQCIEEGQLRRYAEFMNERGWLNGFKSFELVNKLIDIWKELNFP